MNHNHKVNKILETCHERAHECPGDQDDYMLLSITESEFWIMTMGLVLVTLMAPCLEEEVVALQEKLAEVRRHVKQEWIERYDDRL